MAASSTLPQPNFSRKSPIGRSGILTLSGYGIKVRLQSGHLEIEDGVGTERRHFCLPRVGHGLKRLIIVGSDGFVSLAALRWLADQNAAFAMLERNGKVLTVCGPVSPSDARLRRAQALAHYNGKALEISRDLITAKLQGQERVAREQLKQAATADAIAILREQLDAANNLDTVRHLEAQAARSYWNSWSEVAVLFPRQDVKRVPDHWLRFGTRHSPLTGGPRLAVNPPNALLNYCFALAESECRLAVSGCGLDPGLAFIHTDTPARDSLALDLLETIRPSIEAWLLDWITQEPLRRSDFFETGSGNCRLTSRICSQLTETAPTWGRLVAPWAEYISHMLWTGRSGSSRPATRLTQRHKREAKARAPLPPLLLPPRRQNLCRGCGNAIQSGRVNCARCAVDDATNNMLGAARIGRLSANGPEAQAKRAIKARKNALAQHSWKESDQPAWLTPELFSEKIQPLLYAVPMSAIRSALGVSKWYASKIRRGYKPHPRHSQALAKLVGVWD
jgi:CRISPR-associated protein Cas1